MTQLRALLLVALLLAAACGGGSSTPAVATDWQRDLDGLLPAVAAHHPDLAEGVPPALTAEVRRLRARAPALSDDAMTVEVMRLMTHVAAAGRDGHTGVFPWAPDNRPVHSLPLRLWFYPDGAYVEDQLGGHDLVGSRVTGIGGKPLDDVVRAVDPLAAHDNDSTVLLLRPRLLLTTEVLHGLGIVADPRTVRLDVVGPDGAARTVEVKAVDIAAYNAWAGAYGLDHVVRPGQRYLTRTDTVLWHELLRAQGTLYVAFNRVEALDPVELGEIRRLAATTAVRRIVVDVRHNFGGQVDADEPLLDVLEGAAKAGRRIVLLTGRNTFSAGTLFAAKLVASTRAQVVGEATGGAPTSYGDPETVTLERTHLVLSVATQREVALTPSDSRTAVAPTLPVALSAADYFSGRDPVLAAALKPAP